MILKARPPAATPAAPAAAAGDAAAGGTEARLLCGRHVFALEVIPLAVVLEEGGEAERLRLRVEELQNSSDAGAAAVAGGGRCLRRRI